MSAAYLVQRQSAVLDYPDEDDSLVPFWYTRVRFSTRPTVTTTSTHGLELTFLLANT